MAGPKVSDLRDVEREIESNRHGGPFTSDLTGQEFWLVMDRGYVPVGFVLGNSVFSMGVSGGIATALRGLARGELKEYTQLMYDARELALARMKREAENLGADGIVGVNLEISHHGDIMEVTATGTAVRKDPEAAKSGSAAQVVLPV
ncbi:MAG: YbjQ family protein [Alicyclobacillaceae bacterium]|uniref:YbjQ family protein n=1 Tax=Alicyclobacillus sp. SP_1 TaxID=2942475 RepID=UPI0021585703|nr:YbjQ family protein [Alicyclobacillus sp. SP_1]MCY0887081.1 YbjQ family protein [Alicyclobacillaceae bacterium]MCY0896207.1 YbjQ family protein [Alicyclobacillaceae bacterium]